MEDAASPESAVERKWEEEIPHNDSLLTDRDPQTSSTRLPVLHQPAATARESDTAKRERLDRLRGGDKGLTDTHYIRYAPPPTNAQIMMHPRVSFPPLAGCSNRESEAAEKLRVLHAMGDELRRKQAETVTFFHVLYDLQLQSSIGSKKALLQQIVALLLHATYNLPQPEGPDRVANNDPVNFDPSTLDALKGHEYFSLYAHAQQSLDAATRTKQQLETKLEMEQALEHDLDEVHWQLDQDLHTIRTQHLENHERVEAERVAVAQLENDHVALIRQEQNLRKECDGLAQQAERQHTLLTELQSKSVYLDFIARIPLKKHLEQKKLQDQEDLLLAVVTKEEAENARLERELAMLNDQLVSLDAQLEKDVVHRTVLETEVVEAQAVRDATQLAFTRLRDCHTPRPAWDAIVERIPELSNNDHVEWDEMLLQRTEQQNVVARRDGNQRRDRHRDDDGDSDQGVDAAAEEEQEEQEEQEEEEGEINAASKVGGRTQVLVGAILQWIERLQKHCGVNLHLSRIWHDVEEARVELNIVQHQLDQAVRKYTRFGGRTKTPGSPLKQRTKQEYICALGVHEEIPLFLRHQGKVKRHPLKKGELETLIRKVWTEKRQREKRNPHLKLPLEEVLYEKLHRKYGFQPLIAEWGYNLLLSLDLFSWDAEIELFLLCLTHAISDHVFLDQESMLNMCASLFVRLSESYGNDSFVSERRVLLKDAVVALRKLFPLKTSAQLRALEKAMIRDMHKMKRGGNDSMLYIDDVLAKHVSYPHGFFAKAVRQQHVKEIQDYYATLTAELETRDEHKTGELPLHHVREAMVTVDPLADSNAVWNALVRGMGVKSRAQLKMHDVVPYKAFLRQMNTTGLLKFALNFDLHAELNWNRLVDTAVVSPLLSVTTKAQPSKAVVVAAVSRPGTSESISK